MAPVVLFCTEALTTSICKLLQYKLLIHQDKGIESLYNQQHLDTTVISAAKRCLYYADMFKNVSE